MFYRRGAFAAINCDRNSLPTHEILRAEGESRPNEFADGHLLREHLQRPLAEGLSAQCFVPNGQGPAHGSFLGWCGRGFRRTLGPDLRTLSCLLTPSHARMAVRKISGETGLMAQEVG